jgi:hypothetical protein
MYGTTAQIMYICMSEFSAAAGSGCYVPESHFAPTSSGNAGWSTVYPANLTKVLYSLFSVHEFGGNIDQYVLGTENTNFRSYTYTFMKVEKF